MKKSCDISETFALLRVLIKHFYISISGLGYFDITTVLTSARLLSIRKLNIIVNMLENFMCSLPTIVILLILKVLDFLLRIK